MIKCPKCGGSCDGLNSDGDDTGCTIVYACNRCDWIEGDDEGEPEWVEDDNEWTY